MNTPRLSQTLPARTSLTSRTISCVIAAGLCGAPLGAAAQATTSTPQPEQAGFIFAPVSSGNALAATPPSSHASTIVELKNGDLMAAWFTGSREGASDVTIHGARFTGGKWTAPVELAHADHVPCWNPVLFHTADGRLWLYYKYGASPRSWKGARKWSTDEGRTWSAEELLPDGILGPIKDKPLVLADGTIVSGSSREPAWTAWIERSANNRKHWTTFGPIELQETPAALAARTNPISSNQPPMYRGPLGILQPTVVQLEGDHLRFYARTRSTTAKIAASDSHDAGKSWSRPHFIDLPNPNSGIDAVRLRDGRIVMVFNNSSRARTPLNLAISTDGEHFRIFSTLEDTPGEYSYPAIIQAGNGDLLITYTWRRETIKFVRLKPPAVSE